MRLVLVLLINRLSQLLVLHALQLCMCLRDLSLTQNSIPLNLSCRHYPDNSNASICVVQMISSKERSEMMCFRFFVCRQMRELILNSLWAPSEVVCQLHLGNNGINGKNHVTDSSYVFIESLEDGKR